MRNTIAVEPIDMKFGQDSVKGKVSSTFATIYTSHHTLEYDLSGSYYTSTKQGMTCSQFFHVKSLPLLVYIPINNYWS